MKFVDDDDDDDMNNAVKYPLCGWSVYIKSNLVIVVVIVVKSSSSSSSSTSNSSSNNSMNMIITVYYCISHIVIVTGVFQASAEDGTVHPKLS